MSKIQIIALALVAVVAGVTLSAFSESIAPEEKTSIIKAGFFEGPSQKQTINLFVSHGHCSTPFAGVVNNLMVSAPAREDLGNPLENMSISFDVDPNTFRVCKGDDLTSRIKTPGLFIGAKNEEFSFKSTQVYTMGVDWYQVNGKMTIMGIENDVKFFLSGIRNHNESRPTSLVLEGQLNLLDWGLDYDKIVFGESAEVPTQWMHINMKIDMAHTQIAN